MAQLDIKAIRDAIYDFFVADSDLKTALGGDTARRMYKDNAPSNPDSPYCVYQYIAGSPDPTFTSDGEIMTFQFDIYNETASPLDTTTIDDVIKKLTAAYDDATLTIVGYDSIEVTRGATSAFPPVDNTQRFRLDYQITVEIS